MKSSQLAHLFFVIMTLFCSAQSHAEIIQPSQVQAELKAGTTTLVDVREEDEVAYGMVEGAIWMPLSLMHAGGDKLNQTLSRISRSKTVTLYCRSGNRSAKAGDILSKLGFQVKNAGAFSALKNAGLKVTAKRLL